ncbi:putative transcriptional regulator, TetR family [Bradyrhizobium sp. ORS 278]|uniref:TetR/AcrR family transcriptional regulator n=1 Tax=Bradyrhizobium sp. (strain ORS 278) TaxID=114615 RepID=UPI0001508F3E|nr:TetR family transcriptional regulator [Bradyrhizobium sp. ORS 278]CAL77086.1 putative transcriptional regulator, TetR family [Bradyrhizobium sp. ORS 278]
MRKTREQTAESKAKIIDTAAHLLRERGVAEASIADVMAAAGMTQGGFYRHFTSKNDMLTAATRHAFAIMADGMDRDIETAGAEAALAAYVARYLSPEHIAHPGAGCPAAGFGADAGRMPDVLGAEFAAGAEQLITRVAAGLVARGHAEPEARAEAIRTLTMLVGTVVMARALGASSLQDEIVAAAQQKLAGD